MTKAELIAATEREIEMLKANLDANIERAKTLLRDGGSSLGFNLGSIGSDIAVVEGKLRQTERVLEAIQKLAEVQ